MSINEPEEDAQLPYAQTAAIQELLEIDDVTILAWLSMLRALEPGFRCASQGVLPIRRFNAVVSLLEVPDDRILHWLNTARTRCKPCMMRPSIVSDLCRPHDLVYNKNYQNSSTSSIASLRTRSSTHQDSTGELMSSGSCLSPSTSRTSCSRVNSASDISRNLSSASGISATSLTTVHCHWCTHCQNPRAILTCDGWKRHMKEHETLYICMPHGAIHSNDAVQTCALCGVQSPDQEHIGFHNVISCIKKRRQYTRKLNLVKHLELHHAQDCSDLADLWRTTLGKRFFSCGFCVALFTTLNEQLGHVDNHFKQHEDICNWSPSKVIRGLLLQRHVAHSWESVTANYDKSAFNWGQSSKALQLRLELSDEPADFLALAAFNESDYDEGFDDSGLTMLSSDELENTGKQRNTIDSDQQSSVVSKTLLQSTSYSLRNTPALPSGYRDEDRSWMAESNCPLSAFEDIPNPSSTNHSLEHCDDVSDPILAAYIDPLLL